MSRKTTLVLLGALILIPVAGTVYQAVATMRDIVRFPPPGTLVDIGSRRLHLLCIGSGAPVVFFENGAFSNSASLTTVRTELARRTRVCSYDRQGVGWSDPAAWSTTVGALADELGVLQDRAALAPPFIMVASSMGGVVAEMFARRYPERVAALVFLDAFNSGMLPILDEAFRGAPVRTACVLASAAGVTGLARALDPFHLRSQAGEEGERSAALVYGSLPWSAACALVRGLTATRAEFARAAPLRGDVPLLVLSADSTVGLMPPGATALLPAAAVSALIPRLRETHHTLAKQSSRGSWAMVEDSEHSIAGSRPEIVAAAVNEMLASLRSGH